MPSVIDQMLDEVAADIAANQPIFDSFIELEHMLVDDGDQAAQESVARVKEMYRRRLAHLTEVQAKLSDLKTATSYPGEVAGDVPADVYAVIEANVARAKRAFGVLSPPGEATSATINLGDPEDHPT